MQKEEESVSHPSAYDSDPHSVFTVYIIDNARLETSKSEKASSQTRPDIKTLEGHSS